MREEKGGGEGREKGGEEGRGKGGGEVREKKQRGQDKFFEFCFRQEYLCCQVYPTSYTHTT